MADAAREARAECRRVGRRRKRMKESRQKLADDTDAALKKAVAAGLPVAEAARLLDVHRTTVYRVYPPHAA